MWLTWQKHIGATHLNCHYTKCTAKHELVGQSQTQLAFGIPSSSGFSTLSMWMYLEERTHDGMAMFVVNVELLLSIVDNEHFTTLVKEYLQS